MRLPALAPLTALLAAAFCADVGAQVRDEERITSYDSRITVNEDASLSVTETMKVHSLGKEIRHGIYRDFPTGYTLFGCRRTVPFKVVSVLRDGRSSPYHMKNSIGGVRLYFGREDRYLSPGDYTYTLTYTTAYQIGFFEDHDELYWNVTGNDWTFPIEAATATVILPPEAARRVSETNAWLGEKGSDDRNVTSSVDDEGNSHFAAGRLLAEHEGLTVYVAWPKGILPAPTHAEELRRFVHDNIGLALGLLGLLGVAVYYVIAWSAHGRDPAKGTIVPRYEPPRGLGPAAIRYIMRMGYDDETFAAALINAAVKGVISIGEENGVYSIRREQGDFAQLTPGEKKVVSRLLPGKKGRSVKLEQGNHRKIRGALDKLEKTLERTHNKTHFITNRQYFIGGAVASAITVLLSVVTYGNPQAWFMAVWLTGWSAGVAALMVACLGAWRRVVHARGWARVAALGGAVLLSLFSLPFLAGEAFGLFMLVQATAPAVLGVVMLAGVMNVVFFHLLKAPTSAGRRIMDEIEGFRMFLRAAEKDRLNILHPPERTPEAFEKYLPYALALGVEQEWAEQFSDVLAAAETSPDHDSPTWYVGTNFAAMGASGLASSLGGSLSSAISSSSTAPGSSSGGGGSGSSGGGGGGGGGGGW